MRILFISASPIQKEISIGNTFLNLFSDMEDVEFASVYTRAGKSDLSISRGFCITEKMLIKNLIGKGSAGKEVKQSLSENKDNKSNTVTFIKKKRWNIFFLAQNLLWYVGRWKSKALREFIEDYNPDIIFTVFSDKIYLNRMILHIAKLTKKPLMVYAWDNNYSLKRLCFSPIDWIGHFCNRHYMKKVAKKADKLYVISNLQKVDYEKAFHKPCTVITKAEDFSKEPSLKSDFSVPFRLAYTGNLYANRWKSLEKLVNVLERINREGIQAQLDIYTATPITKEMEKALNREGISRLLGAVSSSEVEKIQQEADILVLAEPVDLKNRLTVRQSFSTKIVEYLKAARPIVAVGAKNIAPFKHLLENDCAIVADNEEELYEKLLLAFKDTNKLHEYALQAYMCGRKNHDKKQQKELLSQDLVRLIGM